MMHIKLNGIMKYSNMVANILLADPPPPPWKVEIQLFQNMVMLHIKLKGITKCWKLVGSGIFWQICLVWLLFCQATHRILGIPVAIYVSCLSLLCCLVCSLQPCDHLLGKSWPLASLVCCVFSSPVTKWQGELLWSVSVRPSVRPLSDLKNNFS